ncbi:MAG: hypothetical protein Q9204_007414, partial [Flavoplaca sp. TL-2023a]
ARDRTPTPIDAWSATTPIECRPYAAQIKEAIAEYKAKIQAFNARIPLSPLQFAWEDADDDPIIHYFEQEVYEGGDDDRVRSRSREIVRRVDAQVWNRYRRDHREACGGAITPVPERPFRLLDLPFKLRTIIYGMLLRSLMTLSQMELDGSAESKDGPIDTRIFAVSKQIHEEASDVFFRENVVMVSLGDDAFLGLPPLIFRDDASDTQRAYVKKLRKVAIMLPMSRESEAPRLQWVLERVCRALAHSPRLVKVSVNPYLSSNWYKHQCDALMDNVLESVKLIRKPNTANFSKQSEFGDNSRIRVIGTQAQKDWLCSIIDAAEG